MLKRELKINLKSFLIFMLIIVFMLLAVALIYPSLMTDMVDIDKMMEAFPKEILETFNMDLVSIKSVFGWFATEGYMMITLAGGCFFAILGGTILLKEQDQKTIEYLYSKPISKNKILLNKILTGLIYIVIFTVITGITILIGLLINDDFNLSKFIGISLLPTILNLFFFTTTLFISNFFRKTKEITGLSVGLVFIGYLINLISTLTDKVEFIKYVSIFHYVDSSFIIKENIEIINILIPVGISIMLLILTFKKYNNKELGI